jgi:hypothetical protein
MDRSGDWLAVRCQYILRPWTRTFSPRLPAPPLATPTCWRLGVRLSSLRAPSAGSLASLGLDAAFARAQAEDKPILLDIGAVWCHWCHVMDRESYENPEIAAIINEHYVAVKVDRDERPDVDARYQAAVAAITGQGGWPLTAFLTPDGRPYFGGTYIPPDDRYGRPGFPRVLITLAHVWHERRDEALETACQRHGRHRAQ